jgi:hypothetical protein
MREESIQDASGLRAERQREHGNAHRSDLLAARLEKLRASDDEPDAD